MPIDKINAYKEMCGASAYIETSALQRKNVQECFEIAIQQFLRPKDKKRTGCSVKKVYHILPVNIYAFYPYILSVHVAVMMTMSIFKLSVRVKYVKKDSKCEDSLCLVFCVKFLPSLSQ